MNPSETDPRRRMRLKHVCLSLLALAALVAAGAAGYAYVQLRQFADTPIAGLVQPTQIDVPMGAHLPAIVNLLDERGLHPGAALYWRLLVRQLDVAGKLHAGEYALDAGMTPRGLLKKMAAGEVIQHKFTIVEGWSFRQLREALDADSELKKETCTSGASCTGTQLMAKLGQPQTEPEGQFLPQTYRFVKGMSDIDILRRANDAMTKTLSQLWAERMSDTPLKSPEEALILASIVEKETGRADERPQIARVFLSRLQRGMRLQTDPTVIYGMGLAYAGNIHRRDLETDTPFNTYTRSGLPPTPIAMPGKASIQAVLHPADTEALYFVARGNGSHEFSATLQAHNRAVARYQLNRQTHAQ